MSQTPVAKACRFLRSRLGHWTRTNERLPDCSCTHKPPSPAKRMRHGSLHRRGPDREQEGANEIDIALVPLAFTVSAAYGEPRHRHRHGTYEFIPLAYGGVKRTTTILVNLSSWTHPIDFNYFMMFNASVTGVGTGTEQKPWLHRRTAGLRENPTCVPGLPASTASRCRDPFIKPGSTFGLVLAA